ncbi:MAG: hypothetical protein H6658_02175 [Ardenticatenaceae bacterium]|nr:hypothetical protein [Ardenticatenaceae bacterium]
MASKISMKAKRLVNSYQRFGLWYIIRSWFTWLRHWILEDQANAGLGGPPNNWQSSGLFIMQQGAKHDPDYHYGYSCRFLNDAHEVWINQEEKENGTLHQRWAFFCSTSAFRKMAMWYLWRWAWGEWFGVRRWLYYKWLHRSVSKMMGGIEAKKSHEA